MDRLLRRGTLATLFGVSGETFRVWNNKGWLVVAEILNCEAHYRESAVNAFLAREVHGMPPPTYEQLLKGEVAFVSPATALEQLGGKTGIHWFVHTHRLNAFKLGALWAVEQGSVERRLALRQYTTQNVGKVLGLTQWGVLRALRVGELSWADDPDKIIDPAILEDYVRRHLPEWARPNTEEWIEQRLDSQRSLLTAPQACILLGIPYRRLTEFLKRERIAYISTPGFQDRRISPEAVDDYLSLEPVVSSPEAANWFGVHSTTVIGWRIKGLLVCPIAGHIHDNDGLYESCWLAIIQPLLCEDGFAATWLSHRKRYRTRMLSLKEAALQADMSIKDMAALLAKKGPPIAIRTPTGEWRVGERQLRVYLAVHCQKT